MSASAAFPATRWPRLAVADLGLLPLLAVLPFIYVPKVLEGDTQPWVLLGALLALFLFRPRQFLARQDFPEILLALMSLAAYAMRGGFTAETLRLAYIFVTFSMLWMIIGRGGHDLLRQGVRLTLVVWFAVAAYQYVALQLGLPVSFSGRFMEGRSGVPGLAAEPSYLGSLSVLMMMILLHDRRPGDIPFLVFGLLNVLISGSLLSLLLLGFAGAYMRPAELLAAGLFFLVVLLADFAINPGGGLSARLTSLTDFGTGLVALLLDPSLNLRIGHVWFTLWENLGTSLLFAHPVAFMDQYNQFASRTDLLFMQTESNFILPMAGELVYSGGVFGFMLAVLLIIRAGAAGQSRLRRFIRGSFMLACLLNPVSIANPFLVFYALQRRPCQPPSSPGSAARTAGIWRSS